MGECSLHEEVIHETLVNVVENSAQFLVSLDTRLLMNILLIDSFMYTVLYLYITRTRVIYYIEKDIYTQ